MYDMDTIERRLAQQKMQQAAPIGANLPPELLQMLAPQQQQQDPIMALLASMNGQ